MLPSDQHQAPKGTGAVRGGRGVAAVMFGGGGATDSVAWGDLLWIWSSRRSRLDEGHFVIWCWSA